MCLMWLLCLMWPIRLRGFAHDKVRLNSKPCEFPAILLDFAAKLTWHLSCCLFGQRISFSLLRRTWHEEKG